MSAPAPVSYFDGMFANEPWADSLFAAALELEATCYHEASHAVADYLFGKPLALVGVVTSYSRNDDGQMVVAYGGEVRTRGRHNGPLRAKRYGRSHFTLGCALAAGPAGERRYRHERGIPMRLLGASEDDHRNISGLGKSLEIGGRCRHAFQRHVWHHAQRLIAHDGVWDAISDIADDLFFTAADQPEPNEPAVAWSFIPPKEVYGHCRRNGLRRGAALAA